MTARPIAVGDRVRGRAFSRERDGVVVHVEVPRLGRGVEWCFAVVQLDDDGGPLGGARIRRRLYELERLDDIPQASSAPLTEDSADTLATPCATSATPDTAPPDADPAPEAGAAPAHDAAPAPDLIDLLPRVGTKTLPWQRRWIEAEFSSARRAEGTESPRLVTDDAEEGSDVGASLPTVGGRAVPPVPAPADTTNPDGLAAWELELLPTGTHPADGASPTYVAFDEVTTGAASVHDDAPVTDLAALRDAAYRLRDVRAEIDALLDVEQTLAARVSEGLGTLVGVPVDLNWGTDRPDALADGAR